jgi:hypothetical protein
MPKKCTEIYLNLQVKWVLFLTGFIKLKLRLCDRVWQSSPHHNMHNISYGTEVATYFMTF